MRRIKPLTVTMMLEASKEAMEVGTVIRNTANTLRDRNNAARGGSYPRGNPSMNKGKWHDSQKHAYEVGQADAVDPPKKKRALTRAQMKDLSGYGRDELSRLKGKK